MTRSESGKLGYFASVSHMNNFRLKRKEEAIEKHNRIGKVCLACKKPIPYEKRKNNYCSHSCSAKINNIGVVKNYRSDKNHVCLCCGSKLRRIGKYCNKACQLNYQYKIYIDKWKKGEVHGGTGRGSDTLSHYIRRYLFEKCNNSCSVCGWNKINEYTNKSPLEINHIDGDSTDNNEKNLELLCPNCHSLTKTHKGANKGNGRAWRREQREKEKKEKGYCY